MDKKRRNWIQGWVPLIFFGLLGSVINSHCSGSGSSGSSGSSGGSGGDVIISGEVSTPVSTSISLLAAGPLKFAEQPATQGTVKCLSESGEVLGTDQVDSSGAYSLTVRAGAVENQAIFCAYEDELAPGQFPLHSLHQIGDGEESATMDINPRTDFSTALFLASATSQTGLNHSIGEGVDLTGAVSVVRSDVYRMFFPVVGDTNISLESTAATTDMALEALFEAYQFCLVSGEGEAPLITLRDSLNNNATAQANIQSCLSVAGGGIPINSNVFETVQTAAETIFHTYADTSDEEAADVWELIDASTTDEGDLKAYMDPIVETTSAELLDLEPKKIRNCMRFVPDLGTSTFAASSEPGQAIIQNMKQGNCDNTDTAKFIMAALAATLPECPDGVCDYTSYDPNIAALASSNCGLDLWNRRSSATEFDVKDLADAYASQLRNPNNQQSFALIGTAACGDMNQVIVDGGLEISVADVADVDIPIPPWANCAVGICAAGTTCTTQANGTAICAPLSDKLSKFCSSESDCDSLTYCPPAGRCCLRVGAPTGAYCVGDVGQRNQVGGSGSCAFTVSSHTTSGGRCNQGVCATGLVCRSDICIPAGGGDIRIGLGGSCAEDILCGTHLRCEDGICKAISAGTNLVEGDSCGIHADCESTCCMGGICVKNSACTVGGGTSQGNACTSSSTCSTGYYCGRRYTEAESGQCIANATGQAGQFCEDGTSCMTGLTCTAKVCVAQTTTGGGTGSGGSGGESGTAGTSCTSSATCQTGYYCGRRYGATDNGQCIANGTGQVGQFCETGTSCMTGLTCTAQVCVAETATGNSNCILEGTTSSNSCGSDGQCCSNYCGGTEGSRRCTLAGTGTNGEVCTMYGNCRPGLECRGVPGGGYNTCQAP